MGGSVLKRAHGYPIDHIALAARDTEEAVAWMQDKLGAAPFLTEPEPNQWYWSGGLPIGQDSFVELLGPNPAHTGFNPIKQIIKQFDEPQLLFWYVATDDFDAFAARAKKAGAPLGRIETVAYEKGTVRVDYTRGILGPGFESPRACVIEWRHRLDHGAVDRSVNITDFKLSHPKAATMNSVYQSLGIDITVAQGPSAMGLTLEGPNGQLVLQNPGQSFSGASALLKMAGLYVGYRLGR